MAAEYVERKTRICVFISTDIFSTSETMFIDFTDER